MGRMTGQIKSLDPNPRLRRCAPYLGLLKYNLFEVICSINPKTGRDKNYRESLSILQFQPADLSIRWGGHAGQWLFRLWPTAKIIVLYGIWS